jgi:hypothetical protein
MTASALTFKPIQKLNENFFGIDETEVLYQNRNTGKQLTNFPNKKIIINTESGCGISIVKNNFLSVRHQEAFNLGVTLFEMLFGVSPDIHKESINIKKTDYSVDLISDKCKIQFTQFGYRYINPNDRDFRLASEDNLQDITNNDGMGSLPFIAPNFKDEYHPFLRVSNYLREGNSFYIEMGYYRYRCSNGMMLGKKTQTTFRHSYYVHSFKSIQAAAMEQFLRHKQSFMYMAQNLWKLLGVYVPKANMRLISFDIFEKELMKKSLDERLRLQLYLNDLINKYVLEIGENLNAALNVATDFSKHFEGYKVSKSYIQNLASIWVSRVTTKSFVLEKYFANLHGIEDRVLTERFELEEEN